MKQELTSRFVAEALRIAPPLQAKNSPETFTQVITDSRKVQPGSLFVAIPGEKFDGHDFIYGAIQQGARGIICRRDFPIQPAPGVQFFQVEDTVTAYRRLGGAWRRLFSIPVIVIAGAVGKTTTKELLSAILRGRWKDVLKTQGSQNGFVGIPMTLLELHEDHGAAVVEVGIDEIGAMEQHMQLVAPSASLLTAIGPEHLEKLKDVPTVAREEGIALSYVAQHGGWIAINLDDPWIRPHANSLGAAKKVTYTLGSAEATLRGRLIKEGTQLEIQGLSDTPLMLTLPLSGTHNARNLLAAVAIAHGLGLSATEIKKGLETFQGAEGRSELRFLSGKTPVVADYYNASPVSMAAGLELLTQTAHQGGARRIRWACLGDMLELGVEEERFHRELAKPILQLGIEHVLLYGPRMRALADELSRSEFQGTCKHFETHSDLAAELLERMKSGDAVLIKGSRGMKMEQVWKALEARSQTRSVGNS